MNKSVNIEIACKNFSKDIIKTIYEIGDTSIKIELARWLGRFLTHNFISIYSNDEIEDYLSNLILSSRNDFKPSKSYDLEYTILATTLYKHGGHTRMIETTISSFENFGELILTQSKNSDKEIISKISNELPLISIDKYTANAELKILCIYNRFIKYKNIVVYSNPDDIECAIAIRIDKILNGSFRKYFFVNHSDHTFSYGKTISDIVLEVSNYGWELNKKFKLSKQQSFLGIPINSSISLVKKKLTTKKIVFSGGAPYKFRSAGQLSLYNHLSKLMKTDQNIYTYLIGPSYLTSAWLFKMKIKFPKRFYCINRVDHTKYKKMLSEVSVYVDSYPITGGTAFTEALLTGLKVTGLSGCPGGYGYADRLRTTSENNLETTIRNLLNSNPEEMKKQNNAKSYALNYHGREAFSKRLKDILNNSALIDQEKFSSNTTLDYDYKDIYKAGKTIYCPDLNTRTMKPYKVLFFHGQKNDLGMAFLLKLIIRWAFKNYIETITILKNKA